VDSFLTSLKPGMWPQPGFASATPIKLWPTKPCDTYAKSMKSPLVVPPWGSFHLWTRIGGYGGLAWRLCWVGTCMKTTRLWCTWPCTCLL
jgi:hypothetical protein